MNIELNDIRIRETVADDMNDIMQVEKQAFGSVKEAQLAAGLLNDKTAGPLVSLLAFYKNEAAGHILFTRVYIDGQQRQPLMHILAPLAVKPGYRKKGIGGMLIKEGLRLLQEKGSDLVFVLGHEEYYSKYGFLPHASRLGYPAPYPIPEEYSGCWMVQPVGRTGFEVGKGKIRCSDMLNREEYWTEE